MTDSDDERRVADGSAHQQNLSSNKFLTAPRLALLLLAFLAAVRFVGLEADFPAGITNSFGPLTDEGYYAAPAVRKASGQSPYQAGGFNSHILTPVSPFLQWLSFKSLGVSLRAARVPSVILTLCLFALLASVIWRQVGHWAAVFMAAVLVCHWTAFAYSRVALLDLPMLFFCVAAMLLVDRALASSSDRTALLDAVLAGTVLACAALSKPVAITVVPALLFLAWRGPQRRLRVLLMVAGTCSGVLLAWCAAVAVPYRDDVMLFLAINTRSTWIGWGDEFDLLVGFVKSLVALEPLSILAVVLAFPWGVQAVMRSARPGHGLIGPYRLYGAFWVFWGSFLIFLTYSDYRPVRYLVPWLLLSVFLATWTAFLMWRSDLGESLAGRLLVGVLCVQAILGLARQGRELFQPEYGLRDAAREVKQIVGDDAILYGRPVQQMMLAAGGGSPAVAVTEDFGTWAPGRRLAHYQPSHYMQFGPVGPRSQEDLRRVGELVPLARFEFVRMYGYEGVDAVYLYQIDPPLSLPAAGR